MFCFKVKKLKLPCSEVAKISVSSLFLSFLNFHPFLSFFLMFQFFGMPFIWNVYSSLFFTALIFGMLFIWHQPAWPKSDAAVRSLPHPHPLKCGLCSNPKCDVVHYSFPALSSKTKLIRNCRQIIITVWMSYLLIIF